VGADTPGNTQMEIGPWQSKEASRCWLQEVGFGRKQAAQSSLKILVGSLQLAIGLGVEPRGQAGR
jgi:hypothetical protein